MDDKRKKKSRKERLAEQREFERGLGLNTGIGVKYDQVTSRHMDDERYERELAFKEAMAAGKSLEGAAAEEGGGAPKQASATYDAFMRMATGKQERTIAEKIADSNRPTWDEYKKKNEEALDMEGVALRKMMEYRKELDEARERELKKKGSEKRKKVEISDSDDSSSSDDEPKKKKKKKDKKHKKEKKKHKKKHKKHKRGSASDDDQGSKASPEGSPVPLSKFFGDGDDDSE